MIRTVLVDDEIGSLKVLERLLKECCAEVSIVGRADGVDTAFQLIQETKPDLLFLDIEMTQGNAFDLLNRLQPISLQVIFVTAFDNYAVRAFKFSAVDYLLKPVDMDDLRRAVDKVLAKSDHKDFSHQMKVLLQNVETLQASQQKIGIPTLAGLQFVAIRDIIRFEAKGSYTTIFLVEGEEVVATRNIREYEELLPAGTFCRIHNSHIINLQRMKKYYKGRGGYVVMEDDSSIEVATRRREEFLQRLLK
jgi:two-component system, LytTR family, response regulator